jgi:WG repeat protein
MNPRLRLATFSLQLFLICCLCCLPSEGTGGQGTGETSAELAAANNSLWHQETTQQPSQAADAQSPAKDTDPLFPVVEHGKWGYIDKTGKIVIKPEYVEAGFFKEGMARVQPFHPLLSKAIRVYFIDTTGKILNMSTIYSYAEDFSEGLALVAFPENEASGISTAPARWLSRRTTAGKVRSRSMKD